MKYGVVKSNFGSREPVGRPISEKLIRTAKHFFTHEATQMMDMEGYVGTATTTTTTTSSSSSSRCCAHLLDTQLWTLANYVRT